MTTPGGRFTFPEDQTLFVYQRPGQPILTPPRTGLQIFTDEAGTTLADITTLAGSPIQYSTIYTGEDGLIPEFLGPADGTFTLWARAVGVDGPLHRMHAQYAERISTMPTMGSGDGPPPDDFGVPGSFWVDRGEHPSMPPQPVLYGPKTADGWPEQGTALVGPTGPPGGALMVPVNVATDTWELPHDVPYPPQVTTVDSAGDVIYGDISYPNPSLVVVRFSAPTTGVGILST